MSFKYLKSFFDNSYLKYGLILLGIGLTSYPIIEATRLQGEITLRIASIIVVVMINVFAFVQFVLFLSGYLASNKKSKRKQAKK